MSRNARQTHVRCLRLVLGDQLSRRNPVLGDIDATQDLIWLCEAAHEATQVPSHKARIVLFLSAMRHFAEALLTEGLPVRYLALDAHDHAKLEDALAADLGRLRPARVCVTQPGEYRLLAALQNTCERQGVPLEVLDDDHFLCPRADFERWADGRKTLRLGACPT